MDLFYLTIMYVCGMFMCMYVYVYIYMYIYTLALSYTPKQAPIVDMYYT